MAQTPFEDLTPELQEFYYDLKHLNDLGIEPTARSGADHLDKPKFRSARMSDDEFRGKCERLQKHGWAEQFTDNADPKAPKERYKVAD